MQTITQLINEVTITRDHYPDAFGVAYFSESNPSSRHYVVMRSDAEFDKFKEFYKDYDFKFHIVAR